MTIPVRKCSCGFLMEAVAVAAGETHTALTYVCGHCDRGECTATAKPCPRCRQLTQADAHNQKT